MNTTHKNLVIGVVGDESAHSTWLDDPGLRNFDLCLVYFGNDVGRYSDQADYYFQRKGIKFRMLFDLAQEELGEIVSHYDHIWIPDDDIAATTRKINQLFRLAVKYKLQVSQPAIGKGDVSFESLRHQPKFVLRYTRYVEIMCPLFTSEAFSQSLPTFQENHSGWGIDWVWSWTRPQHEVGVIDAVSVHHTRPLNSGGVHHRLRALGINPGRECRAIRSKYAIRNKRHRKGLVRGTARLQGINKNGEKVWTRPLLWWPRKAA
jgi:hypothetical protein